MQCKKERVICRFPINRRSHFRKLQVEDHQPVGAPFERRYQASAGALMRLVRQ